MTYKVERQSQDLHDYALHIKFENVSAKPVNDWHVDVEIPTPSLKNAASHVGHVRERSNDNVTLIRFTISRTRGRSIRATRLSPRSMAATGWASPPSAVRIAPIPPIVTK